MNPKIERIGDDLFDIETGEYAGPADSSLPKGPIQTEDELLAYTKRLNRAEADVLIEEQILQGIIDNAQKILAAKKRKVEWLKTAYQESANEVAMSLLPRKADGSFRSKTYTCPWAQFAFRDTKAKVVVVSQTLAVEWAKTHAPEAVKVVESVLVSKIPETYIEKWVAREYSEDSLGFTIEPARQSVTVTTVKDPS